MKMIDYHRLADRDLDLLSTGRGDHVTVAALQASQLSKHLLLWRALRDAVADVGSAQHPEVNLAVATDLLGVVERVAPDVVRRVLLHPHVGGWLSRCLQEFNEPACSSDRPRIMLAHGVNVAVSAAAQAGVPCEVPVTLRDGCLHLPMLGTAQLSGETATVTVDERGVSVRTGSRSLQISPHDVETHDWLPLRRITADFDGLTLAVDLEDVDPFRDHNYPDVADRLSEGEVSQWRELLSQAWALLTEDHRGYAVAIAAGLRSIVPQRSVEPDRSISATSTDAFGSVALSMPSDAVGLANTLIHEFQHAKLAALLDIVPLVTATTTATRYYAPWRDDPRPLGGLLQGTYAFLGVTDFWRRHRRRTGPLRYDLADFEFNRWLWQTTDACEELDASNELTDVGRRFVAGMTRTLRSWSGEVAPGDDSAQAHDASVDHRARWRLRNLRPVAATITALADAWLDSQRPPDLLAPPVLTTNSTAIHTDTTRLRLWHQRRTAPSRFDADTVDASPGDVQYVLGDYTAAIETYRQQVITNADPSAWTGLALARHRTGDLKVAAAILDRPETLVALDAELRVRGRAVDPEALALWLCQRGDVHMTEQHEAPKLPVIDADCHVVEPFELWAEELPEQFQPFARQRETDVDGNETLFHHGRELDLEWTIGTLCTPGSGSAAGRLDINIDTEVHPGVNDPTARLKLMDEQGIAVSVLFPSCTLGLDDVEDIEFRWAYARTYNSWIARFCATDPIRLKWGAVLPLTDVDRAVAELDRCVELGCSTVMLSPLPRSGPGAVPFADPARASHCRNLGHPELDPLYRRLVELNMPATVHVVNPAANALGMGWVFANRIQWQMGQPFQAQLAVLHVIDGGVLDRFPTLRMGFFEGDVGWLPHWLGRFEETYDKFALMAREHVAGPIDQFRRQLYVSGEPADLGLAHAVDLVGASHVLFASDWPHMDGAWPDPIMIVRDRADLSSTAKRAILVDGPAEYFALDTEELMRHLGTGWSLDADIADLKGMLPEGYAPATGHRTEVTG